MNQTVAYECGICDGLHLWEWDGDCRCDAARFGDAEEIATHYGIDPLQVEVRPWADRVEADANPTPGGAP